MIIHALSCFIGPGGPITNLVTILHNTWQLTKGRQLEIPIKKLTPSLYFDTLYDITDQQHFYYSEKMQLYTCRNNAVIFVILKVTFHSYRHKIVYYDSSSRQYTPQGAERD